MPILPPQQWVCSFAWIRRAFRLSALPCFPFKPLRLSFWLSPLHFLTFLFSSLLLLLVFNMTLCTTLFPYFDVLLLLCCCYHQSSQLLFTHSVKPPIFLGWYTHFLSLHGYSQGVSLTPFIHLSLQGSRSAFSDYTLHTQHPIPGCSIHPHPPFPFLLVCCLFCFTPACCRREVIDKKRESPAGWLWRRLKWSICPNCAV